MTLCSYEYQSEIQYDYRVLHAQIDLMDRGLDFQQSRQRQLYRGGVHFCPTCTAQALRDLGQYEESGWLFDRSSFNRSDINEKVMDVLHRFALYSDSKVDPRLKVNFTCQSRPSEHLPRGRYARYAHLKDQGKNCKDFEHEIVIRRIGYSFLDALQKQYPHLEAKVDFENKIDEVNRKPDIRLQLLNEAGVVVDDTAIELQKSTIGIEIFQQRTRDLQSVLSRVIWVFKKSLVTRGFLEIVRYSLAQGIPIFSYDIEGEPNSDDCNIKVAQIMEADLPERKGIYGGRKETDSSQCARAEEDQNNKRSPSQSNSRVSARSKVILDYSRTTLFQTIVPPHLRFVAGTIVKDRTSGKRLRIRKMQGNIAVCLWMDEVIPLCEGYWPATALLETDSLF